MTIQETISQGEGYDLEFKRVPNEERIKYLKTVVAFANGKGGTILFGVANDGSVSGIDKSRVFAEMDGIADSIYNACSPRVEITSPGGLPRGLTVEKVLAGRSKIRNHALAEAFNYMNVIEEWGSGLRRVLEELAAYGTKPLQIEDGGIDVRVNVFRNAALEGEESEDNHHVERGSRSDRQKSTPKEVGVNERVNERANEKVNEKVNERVNERQAAIIAIVSDNPYITQSELASRLGISLVHVNKNMKKLQGLGVIRRVGPDKGGHWEILQGQGRRSEPQLQSDVGSSPPQREGAGN